MRTTLQNIRLAIAHALCPFRPRVESVDLAIPVMVHGVDLVVRYGRNPKRGTARQVHNFWRE